MADLPPQSMPAPVEHLNIKVTDNNNEVFFKIKRSTQLKKLMDAFCERQGKQLSTVRFLFDGTRVRPDDSPETVSTPAGSAQLSLLNQKFDSHIPLQLDMQDGDTLEVHQEQIGG
ncbi:uncharacterized protein ARB_02845 [Trichophyton benhamiae CBS 112371]|uniref:Rad60/SUMO-like domain-containing protein n=1 Tax=Arthroderma benhamiae (strain ATCC MYA-4681 / CBS 112371) TaxID=663331 RepID=D4B311_ARTBC|nr:uncharacterized protein ARB_02845 [Trichophyton benhamiae CBS 112371]EFE30307.1 hypothetical protein ARB_02845 [Trichophyton benhamiae CBS 112371]